MYKNNDTSDNTNTSNSNDTTAVTDAVTNDVTDDDKKDKSINDLMKETVTSSALDDILFQCSKITASLIVEHFDEEDDDESNEIIKINSYISKNNLDPSKMHQHTKQSVVFAIGAIEAYIKSSEQFKINEFPGKKVLESNEF